MAPSITPTVVGLSPPRFYHDIDRVGALVDGDAPGLRAGRDDQRGLAAPGRVGALTGRPLDHVHAVARPLPGDVADVRGVDGVGRGVDGDVDNAKYLHK